MFKDRTTATVFSLAVIAIVVMVLGLAASAQSNAQIAQATNDMITVRAPTYAVQTQVAANLQSTQVALNATATTFAVQAQATSAAFMATEAADPDVITTASGLEYKVEVMGTGPKPGETDTVTVNYRGTLMDGTVFDSSYDRGQPATFPLNQVIPGWTEGVQLMPVGSKFIFYLPPELAYGAQGAGGVIPPNAALIFEVELLAIPSQGVTQEVTAEATEAATPAATALSTEAVTPEATATEMVTPEATATEAVTPEVTTSP